jgi:SAM-dependent methyltransferase
VTISRIASTLGIGKIVEQGHDAPPTMRSLRPPLEELGGHSREAICQSLCSTAIEGAAPNEMAAYARHDCERFIRTVGLVPDQHGEVLEIGGAPWFTSLLIRWFRPDIRSQYTNFFSATEGTASQSLSVVAPTGSREDHHFVYSNVNVEAPPPSRFPYDDASFDGVLFCEVIEHLQMNPLRALREIWRVLKPGGWLILTTPNIARMANVHRIVAGLNIHDPYSAYGPYGRHNREFSVGELNSLMPFCGFDPDQMFTSDVHGDDIGDIDISPELWELIKSRRDTLGLYIFSRWRKAERAPIVGKPDWLYSSYPADQMVRLACTDH